MPIAAVPRYLGQNFEHASPGLRFGLYLAVWTDLSDQEREVRKRAARRSAEGQEIAQILDRDGMDAAISALRRRDRARLPGLWEKNDSAAREAWRKIAALSRSDRALMNALAERQAALAAPLAESDQLQTIHAQCVAPFTTGLGNEHPLENGFAFLNPYGLPYLAGSGVKGVLRQAARELAQGEWGETRGWDAQRRYEVRIDRQHAALLSMSDVLFGLEPRNGGEDHVRGALTFWDVIPQIKGDRLMVEVMTAHQSHYYQKGETPHESGQPNPINFLTVPPGSGFAFHVQCNRPFLERNAPDLAEGDRWKALLAAAFEHAFAWLGFGAKTAVGYGAMARDRQAERAAEERAEQARLEREKQKEREEAVAGLPEDAAWIKEQELTGAWKDNNALLDGLERWLGEREALSLEAQAELERVLEARWRSITSEPDAVHGKKKKPKFSDRPRKLAKRLLELKSGG